MLQPHLGAELLPHGRATGLRITAWVFAASPSLSPATLLHPSERRTRVLALTHFVAVPPRSLLQTPCPGSLRSTHPHLGTQRARPGPFLAPMMELPVPSSMNPGGGEGGSSSSCLIGVTVAQAWGSSETPECRAADWGPGHHWGARASGALLS